MNPILLDLPMPVTTPRLLIKPPQLGDGAVLNSAILQSYKNVKHTMPWLKEEPSIEQSEEFVRQAAANWILKKDEEPYLPLFIFDKQNLNFVGGASFHHIKWEVSSLEIGYWINNQHAEKGYMTEAVNALTQYAIKQLKMKRIAVTCDISNIRSRKIPERLGYILEATLKLNRINPITGKLSDTLVFTKYDINNLPALDVIWEKTDTKL